MIIAFRTRAIRKLCEKQSYAEDRLGIKAARNLRARYADLKSAKTLKDLVAGLPKKVDNGVIQVSIGEGTHILIKCNHNKTPRLKSKKLDWSKVKRVQIIAIGDYDA